MNKSSPGLGGQKSQCHRTEMDDFGAQESFWWGGSKMLSNWSEVQEWRQSRYEHSVYF